VPSKTADISLKTRILSNFKKMHVSQSQKIEGVKFSTEGLSPKSLAKIENPDITGLMNPVIAKLIKQVSYQKLGTLSQIGLTNPILTGLRKVFDIKLQQG